MKIIHCRVIAACVLTMLPIKAICQNSGILEATAHGHHFYSESRHIDLPSISYLVCNKTDEPSDFFWESVGFGLDESKPLPAHHCIERVDLVSAESKEESATFEEITTVNVLEESAEVPAILWCKFGSFDRCDTGLVASISRWSSTLRIFGEGGTDSAFQPVLSMGIATEGGGYLLQIERSEQTGRLIVVAVTEDSESVVFKPVEAPEIQIGSLRDFIEVSNGKIFSSLSERNLSIQINANPDYGSIYEIIVFNLGASDLVLAILSINEIGSIVRLDTLSLPSQVQ